MILDTGGVALNPIFDTTITPNWMHVFTNDLLDGGQIYNLDVYVKYTDF